MLLREVPFLASLRLWDTYLAEGPRMKDFLKYVLAAFLLSWSQQLAGMDFQVHDSDTYSSPRATSAIMSLLPRKPQVEPP